MIATLVHSSLKLNHLLMLLDRVIVMIDELKKLGINLKHIDIGGGLGFVIKMKHHQVLKNMQTL